MARWNSLPQEIRSMILGLLFGCFAFELQVCPSVQAVTKFLLPRQCRRRIGGATISCILERLPRLKEISLETWDVSEIYVDNYVDRFARHLFSHPEHFKNVKSMTVFQDRNEPLNAAISRQRDEFRRRFPLPTLSGEVPCHRPVLAREIAVASLSLENLSLSFTVDALDFFDQCRENWLWADLRSLTLTSRLLTCNGDSAKIHGLLQTAAQMAKRMPKLERLIIWNGGANEASAFTYRKQQHIASVTWQAKGGTKLNPEVYSTWENLHSGCFLSVEEKDTWHSITSQAAAIMCLGLEHVVDHVSLRQMQLENSIPWGDV
ncbi:f-box domain-containing protein [Fusarium mundagurra]|uniref:F-box domain-containing protein n=1 Tax=Fusarium mundagurra TaxID=1567541 RepID=A0A8H6DMK7_9HYPO|nr:f-box domain-containing protein [Fusarium mundagurra]